FKIGKSFGQFCPFVICHHSQFIYNHFTVFYMAKPTNPVLTTNGNKIQSCLRIIISFKAYAAAMMFLQIVLGLANVHFCAWAVHYFIFLSFYVCTQRWRYGLLPISKQ